MGGQDARGPGSPPSTPSRMHPKIMLYPLEFVLKLRSMEGNNTAAGRGLKAFVESETFTSRTTHLELRYMERINSMMRASLARQAAWDSHQADPIAGGITSHEM